jgi:outer membrane protein assembly factor BamA
VRFEVVYELPLDGELELNVTSKSNNQAGPGAVVSLTRRNLFKGGEVLGITLRGSYEWQTGNRVNGASNSINSYELGLSGTLTFPRIIFPGFQHKIYDYPANTTFKLYADQLNRSRFFKLLAFGGSASYSFQPTASSKHTLVPFRLTYNLLQSTTHEFDSITAANPALYLSLKNQFIPAMSYTYTYDNAMIKEGKNQLWWESSITSAGNILSGINALAGKSFTKGKTILGNPYAQFIKLTSEIRVTHEIDRNQQLAMRLMGGFIYSYGNATISPYSEQFYIGGANSIRAFTVRSIGPGRFRPNIDNPYSYIDQTGDVKLEANIEYRFRMIENLHGAVFLDAGNIWLLRNKR